jgi:DNA-binding NarL/FixJ family response regulator
MRILLADHHPQSLWALKTMLQERSEFNIIGEAEDVEGLLALACSNHPDLVLMDGELPGKSVPETIVILHAGKPSPIVIVMGNLPDTGRRLLKAGADAFISKSDYPEWLLETLEKYDKQLPFADSA